MADTKFSDEIGDQWRNYILQKFSKKPSWSLLTQILGDKLTPESFNTINKIYGIPVDTTPLRPPLMQKSAQQTPNNQKDFVPAVEPTTQNDKTDKPVVVIGGSGRSTGGTYSTPKPTPMYNPDNVSLAYSLSNTPISPEMQRQALIDKWNLEHGRTGSTGYATGKGMLTSSNDGTYATGEGIKDANGNVLTNPGGDWEYQYALKNPQYGLGMMGKMSDAQKNYLQAVSDNMGYKYNFTGANRFV